MDRLNRRRLGPEGAPEATPAQLLKLAVLARNSGAPARAERLARRVLAAEPDNLIAAAIVSSVLRERGRPKAALAITDRFEGAGDGPVLTTRAAALCDLKRWAEALVHIQRAIEIERRQQGAPSPEALAVLDRIQAQAPELLAE